MKILLTNDDGYLAKGIRSLFTELKAKGYDVKIIAPEHNCSGAAQSIAVYNPISIHQTEHDVYYVTSTPADCVRLGLQEVYGFNNYPDLVISGINHGENAGDDVLYSGTVGAAREGRLHGISALATSTRGSGKRASIFNHMDSAAKIVVDIVDKIYATKRHETEPFVWNINIPNQEYEQILGYKVVPLGLRPHHEELIKQVTPRQTEVFWQGYSGIKGESTFLSDDLDVLANGKYVSITPLSLLPTAHDELLSVVDVLEV